MKSYKKKKNILNRKEPWLDTPGAADGKEWYCSRGNVNKRSLLNPTCWLRLLSITTFLSRFPQNVIPDTQIFLLVECSIPIYLSHLPSSPPTCFLMIYLEMWKSPNPQSIVKVSSRSCYSWQVMHSAVRLNDIHPQLQELGSYKQN